MDEIKNYIGNLEIGRIQTYKNLAIAPILGEDSNLEHLVLSDALQKGLEIKEKGMGSVPILFAVNRTGKNVLAITGEYIVGGRQNRTITRNIYFDKQFEGEIPVRCVQQGRWSYSLHDNPLPEFTFPEIDNPIEPHWPGPFPYGPPDRRRPRIPRFPRDDRIRVHEEVLFKHGGQAPVRACFLASSQGETWNSIAGCLDEAGVRSASSDLNAVYKERKEDFDKYKNQFPVVDGQIGNIAVISKEGNKMFVLDLFDRQEIASKYHGNLVSSYVLEAGLGARSEVETNKDEARNFLRSINSCDFQSQQPVSLGKDYLLEGNNLRGSALIYKKTPVYINLVSRKQDKVNPGQDNLQVRSDGLSSGFYRVL